MCCYSCSPMSTPATRSSKPSRVRMKFLYQAPFHTHWLSCFIFACSAALMVDIAGNNAAATKHANAVDATDAKWQKDVEAIQEFTWPKNAAADASSGATEQATVRDAIAKWQAKEWRNSNVCHRVIQVMLSLRCHRKLPLAGILAQHLPPLFTPNTEDAFFTMLHQRELTDATLCSSIVRFLATWPGERLATYAELLANSPVKNEMNVCLPKGVSMWRWITRRMTGQMYMTRQDCTCGSNWAIHVCQQSALLTRVAREYRTLNS